MITKTLLLALLLLLALAFIAGWLRELVRRRREAAAEPGTEVRAPSALQLAIGLVTDFLDTLSIGSFATTTALFRWLKQVPDRVIPGTLNVGHALPTVLQALIYISAIQVEPITLTAMIGAATVGAWLGARLVADLPRRQVQLGMGMALLVAGGIVLVRTVLQLEPEQTSAGLTGTRLAIGVAANFVLGALMTVGVGLYAPCLVLVQMLGMSSTSGFPIMMGSCAFLMPVAGYHFIRRDAYSPRAALGLTLGGLLGVTLAAWLFFQMPLHIVNWLVIVVVLYTATSLIRSAIDSRPAP